VVEDEENRKALYERLLFSLEDEADPWHEPEKAHGRYAPVRAPV
jgi:nitrite reductase (NADH) large subunit